MEKHVCTQAEPVTSELRPERIQEPQELVDTRPRGPLNQSFLMLRPERIQLTGELRPERIQADLHLLGFLAEASNWVPFGAGELTEGPALVGFFEPPVDGTCAALDHLVGQVMPRFGVTAQYCRQADRVAVIVEGVGALTQVERVYAELVQTVGMAPIDVRSA